MEVGVPCPVLAGVRAAMSFWMASFSRFFAFLFITRVYSKQMTLKKRSLAVRRTTIGLGLFALESIPANKRIIEYVGKLVPIEAVDERPGKYYFGVNTKWAIDGRERSNLARYINHSCRPNAQAFISGHRVWVWSKKRIEAGQEITVDYGKDYFEKIIEPIGCKCGKCLNNNRRPGGR